MIVKQKIYKRSTNHYSHDRVGDEHLPTAEMRSDRHSTKHEGRETSPSEEGVSERCMALDAKVGKAVEADPLNQASPPRATDTKSEHGGGVSEDRPQQHAAGSQKRLEGEQEHLPRQLSPPTSRTGRH